VSSPVRTLAEPIIFGKRSFPEGCSLTIHGLAPFHEGVVLRDHVDRLSVFPEPKYWSVHMRRASLRLPAADAELIRNELRPLLKSYKDTIEAYRWPR
jgi:hypothetical protein